MRDCLVLLLFTLSLGAQSAPEAFRRQCAACHGANGLGGERGPSLQPARARSQAALSTVILHGVPARGMPAFKLPPAVVVEMVAFIRSLPERKIATVKARETSPEDFGRVAEPREGEWPSYNGRLDGNRHSSLRQIDSANVKDLAVAWMFTIPDSQRLQVTPVIMDGVMYVTTANQVIALQATSGRQLWHYRRERTKGLVGDASGGINRGVAVLGDRVFFATDHAHLVALHRKTGELLWDVEMADYRQNYGATAAPLVADGLVVSGVSGGDEGVRGFLAAFDANTGKRAWTFWTVPERGEPAAATWVGKALEHGCSTTWLTGSYDTSAKLLYWTTGNPCPDYNGDERKGDNLYSNSVVALDPARGKLRWHFQYTPHDLHDWDSVQTPVLVDTAWQGRERKLLLQGNRNGFFYVLDRLTGEFLHALPFALQTWAVEIDAKGRPLRKPGVEPTAHGVKVCPAVEGATNWFSPAFHPGTGLFYLMAMDKCTIFTKSAALWKRGESFYGGDTQNVPGEQGRKFLRAIDVAGRKIAWELPLEGKADTWGGVLSTDGGLLFFGDDDGSFAAVHATSGKRLWSFRANTMWKASPMTYAVEGRQFVAVAAGGVILTFALPDRR